jgi:hypothetical protein
MNREEGRPLPAGAGVVETLNLVREAADPSDECLEEPLELSIELLEERLAPDHLKGFKRTAGWGC